MEKSGKVFKQVGLLRNDYDNLNELIQLEKLKCQDYQQNVDELNAEILEVATSKGIEYDDLKLKNVELKSKIRKVESQVMHYELFQQYDSEIERLTNTIIHTYKSQIAFLKELFRHVPRNEKEKDKNKSKFTIRKNELKLLDNKYLKLFQQLTDLQHQNRVFKKEGYKIKEYTLELNTITEQNYADKQKLSALLGQKKMLQKQVNALTNSNQKLDRQNEQLLQDKAFKQQDVHEVELQAAHVLKARKADERVDKLVQKHLDYSQNSKKTSMLVDISAAREKLSQLDKHISKKQLHRLVPIVATLRVELENANAERLKRNGKRDEITNALVEYVVSKYDIQNKE